MFRKFKSFALAIVLVGISVAACSDSGTNISEFWRPISEPNILLPIDRAQNKLNFDVTQCRCGIFPTNIPQAEINAAQPDKQRLSETSVTLTPDDEGNCIQRPSLVVQECMRGRGWEVTNCSGRMSLPGGGSLCTAFIPKVED